MANGLSTCFWELGQANPRLVAGFFSPDDLKRLLFLRQNRRALESVPINASIVDRPYQHEAIRRLSETFAAGRRRALLVMATGTGKTRTTMAIIDLFLRAHQAQNVLFLADRDALVDQALTDGFKAHLPHEPRDRIYTYKVEKTSRLFVATEQTMSLCYQSLAMVNPPLRGNANAHIECFLSRADAVRRTSRSSLNPLGRGLERFMTALRAVPLRL